MSSLRILMTGRIELIQVPPNLLKCTNDQLHLLIGDLKDQRDNINQALQDRDDINPSKKQVQLIQVPPNLAGCMMEELYNLVGALKKERDRLYVTCYKADPVKALDGAAGKCMKHVLSFIWGDQPQANFSFPDHERQMIQGNFEKYDAIAELTCTTRTTNTAPRDYFFYMLELSRVSKDWKALIIHLLNPIPHNSNTPQPPEGFERKDVLDAICDCWIRNCQGEELHCGGCTHKCIQPLLSKVITASKVFSESIHLRLFVPDNGIQQGAIVSPQRELQKAFASSVRYVGSAVGPARMCLNIRIEAAGVSIEDYLSPELLCNHDFRHLAIIIHVAKGVMAKGVFEYSLDYLFFSKIIQNLPSLESLHVTTYCGLVPSGGDDFHFTSSSLQDLQIVVSHPGFSVSLDCPQLRKLRMRNTMFDGEKICCQGVAPFFQDARAGITAKHAFFHCSSALSTFFENGEHRLDAVGWSLAQGEEPPVGLDLASKCIYWSEPELIKRGLRWTSTGVSESYTVSF